MKGMAIASPLGRFAVGVAALAVIGPSGFAWAAEKTERRYGYDIFDRVELGRGWSSSANSLTNAICLNFGRATQNLGLSEGSLRLVTDTFSLAAELGFTVKHQIEAIAGTIEQSSKVDMAFETETSTSQSKFVARKHILIHKRVLSAETAPGKRIEVRKSYENLSDAEFRRTCGDGYVSQILYGGELNLVATLTETSVDARTNNSAAFKGGSKVTGTSVSAQMKVRLNTHFESGTLDVSHTSIGGTDPQIESKPAKFLKTFNEWQVSKETAAPIFFVVKEYGSLRSGIKMKKPRHFTAMQEIAIVYWRLDNLRNLVEDLLDIDADKKWGLIRSQNVKFTDLDTAISDDLEALKDAAQACVEGKSCVFPKSIDPYREYHLRTQLPYPVGPDVNPYHQPSAKRLKNLLWQYWLQDVNKERIKNGEPYHMRSAQLVALKKEIQKHVKGRPYPKWIHLKGSYRHSCKKIHKRWHGDRTQITMKCSMGKDFWGVRHWKNQKKIITSRNNGSSWSNCKGTLKRHC